MMASGSVGGVGRDLMSTPSCGEHAFVLGALRVRSGIFRTQLVLSWNPMETADLEEVQRLATDPYYHRKLPQDDLASHALQAVAIEAKVPGARGAWLSGSRSGSPRTASSSARVSTPGRSSTG